MLVSGRGRDRSARMPHVIERASTGRAKCRGCGGAIAKDTWRVGEAVPNPFADGENAEARHWYHPRCAAYRRPVAFLDAVAHADAAPFDDRERLLEEARRGVAHERLPRLDQAERAPSGRAACRQCRTPIPKDAWRLTLRFWEEGRFVPAGYLHPGCVAQYAGTGDVLDRVRVFTPTLTDADLAELAAALAAGASSTPGPPEA